jgi:hypothetical protein
MADLAMDTRPRAAPARSLAIAVSVAAHALAFLALFWRLGAAPAYQELPAMNVQLAPWPQTVRRPPPPRPVETQRSPAKPSQESSTTPTVLSRPAVTAQESGAVPQAPPSEGEGASVRNALRGLGGCSHADLLTLSPSERQACLDRLAKAPAAGAMALDLDGRGYAAAKAREPYLQRKPKNGCKVGAGGDTAPSGNQGAAAGVGCAWSF